MVKQMQVLCDKCKQPGMTWTIVMPGGEEARELDLCERHSKALRTIAEAGTPTTLPRQRKARFAVTPLKDAPAKR